MNFILKQYDLPLLSFHATTDTSQPEIEITWHDEENRGKLPLDLELSAESLRRWLLKRIIPKNRAFTQILLAKCGLNLNRPMSIIHICKGLSLNDCYWVVEENDASTFDAYNLYSNPFNNSLAAIALAGFGGKPCSSLRPSPEFTTNGMLPKCWRRSQGKIYLYKGGTEGASNAGFEPYSEYYAAQVGKAMGIDITPYGLSMWKGRLCSVCELFTSRDVSYLPIGRLVTKGGMQSVIAYYEKLGPEFLDSLHKMMIFDAVICNVDRHFENFGVLIDNQSNKIIAPAPLFDHGNSLFNFAGTDCWESEAALDAYISTLEPSVYDDFVGTARSVLSYETRQRLRRLLSFHIQRHSRYNLPVKRLRMIERQIRKRAQLLLEQ